ncbi:hypothetical protein Murru_1376 [Allomuricauda ruestringensis DSM 13258]|uniref:Uncharacterized protein n=1 Tax=Allomuricauda ruestringensis (strain DSM 13258 / CIP 107369 / LMG 19739 / B1) TaxID=886377 RepID=G2PPN6_ALLRU|nr:DUF6427 family protein [Allomuricauda ruestringensis]AEM70417.1 hypothetical protein Murru_1376 [Allomuricauda ruestringensis DSM 13258]
MISSFFGKTKPINYIVLAIILFLFYFTNVFFQHGEQRINEVITLEILLFAALLLSIFIINQIVRTEKATESNSYAMVFFVLLIVTFSDELVLQNVIFANFFLLLAFWRILSIKSIRNVKHKIFDASLLIALASLFYDWSLAFMLLVFFVIGAYDRKTFKNWLVPFIGMGTIFILTFTVLKLKGSLDFFEEHYQFSLGLFTTKSFFQVLNIKTLVYLILTIIVSVLVFVRLRNVSGGKLLLLRIVFMIFVLGTGIILFTPADASPVLITFFPAAVFFTNYFEGIKKRRLQEVVLILTMVVACSLFAIHLN